MDLFAQGVKDGHVTVYTDTPETVIKKLNDYNNEMSKCRSQRTMLRYVEGAMFFGLPAILLAMFITCDYLVTKPLMTALLYGAAAAAGIIFTILKWSLPAALFMLLPLPLDSRAAMLFLLALLLAVLHIYEDSRLKKHRGYPAFIDINITYSAAPDPDSVRTGITDSGALCIVYPYEKKPDCEFIISDESIIKRGKRVHSGGIAGMSGYEFVPQTDGRVGIFTKHADSDLGHVYECISIDIEYDLSMSYSVRQITEEQYVKAKKYKKIKTATNAGKNNDNDATEENI
ncbi:MAG: hypothetical protein J6M17_01215 [Ruminococcus sp.]|nr:hypothetical protein [Ruminococcus sp.]